MTHYVALLRGINVGPHRRVAMADLRALMGGLGYGDVQTLLQSGNAVFAADGVPEQVTRDLEREIAAELGVEVEVVVRMADSGDQVDRQPPGVNQSQAFGRCPACGIPRAAPPRAGAWGT
jgi:uncharacterized protein (DUF1697 family)